jgi:hypothetical protein
MDSCTKQDLGEQQFTGCSNCENSMWLGKPGGRRLSSFIAWSLSAGWSESVD